jgi:EmrB/QacA subfamily drug resistance transporter
LLRESRRPAVVRGSPRAHWYVVATVCIGAFMGQLDASIVTIALPHIGRDLHAGVGAVEWVALSYLLVLVASVATVGRIADAVGRKLLYVYGFGVFVAGSALCGFAPTLTVLIAARALQAIGAAMLQANSVALIAEAVPRPLLPRAIGVQGSAQALGLALGPAIGGTLLSLGGWRLIFLVNLPAGVVGLVLGWLLLPRSRSRRELGAADRLGALLLGLAAAGPLVYLSLAARDGYSSPWLLALLAGGVVAGFAFVRRERRVPCPLVDLSILRRPALGLGLSSGLVSYLALFGILFVVPYYLSAERVGAVSAGLQLAMLPVAIGLTAPLAGRLVERAGGRVLTGGGLILAAAGMIVIGAQHDTAGLLAGLALAGVGLGAFMPANNSRVMSASPPGQAGLVSGLLNMARGLGTALGVAVAGALYAAVTRIGDASAGHTSAVDPGSGLTAALVVLGALALASGLILLLRRTTLADTREGARGLVGHRAPASKRRLLGTPDSSSPTIPINGLSRP